MEVHHHPHAKKKNFKEYFFEFLMIFLAVTLGFFAENIREHFVNSEKEKNYMKGMLQDLEKDTAEYHKLLYSRNLIIKKMDSALSIPVANLRAIPHPGYFLPSLLFRLFLDQCFNRKRYYYCPAQKCRRL